MAPVPPPPLPPQMVIWTSPKPVRWRLLNQGGIRIGSLECEVYYLPERHRRQDHLKWQVLLCRYDEEKSISEHFLYPSRAYCKEKDWKPDILEIPFDPVSMRLKLDDLKLGMFPLTDVRRLAELNRKRNLLGGFGTVKYERDGHVVVPMVRLLTTDTNECICYKYFPPLSDANRLKTDFGKMAVSMNPVDEDDGKLSLLSSAEETQIALASDEAEKEEPYSCDSEGMDSCTTGDGVVTHGVHPNQDAVASQADILRNSITEAIIVDEIKNCALYEEPDRGNPSLAVEFKPRFCAVSTNPVDEDDGKLSLLNSGEEDFIMRLSWAEETIQEVMSLDSCEIYDRMKGFPDLDDDAVSQKAAATPDAVVETDGEVESEYTVKTEETREAYNGMEEGDVGVLSEHNKAVLDGLPMKELLGSIYDSHVHPRRGLQITKKFPIQQQSTRSSEMTFKSSTTVRPPQPELPSNCVTDVLEQDWRLDQLFGCDDSGVYNDSTRHDPGARPNTGPGAGPNTGPAGGPNTGPAGGPNTGPGYTVNQNLVANESFGNESALPLKPVGNPHHRTRMQNHNTGSSGFIAAPSSTDTKIQRPELANGFQHRRKTQTKKAHGSKAKPVTSSPFSRAAEKRRSSSPEPIGSSRGCKERMVLCAEPPKLVPVTVEFATDGGGDFTPTVLNDISPPTSPELFPPYTAPHMPTGLDFSSTIGTSSGELPGKQIAQGDRRTAKKSATKRKSKKK